MPDKIIIVRHGETDHNVKRILQGWLNIPLNSTGHEQAARVAKRLASEFPVALYSSDHLRAYQTASHISQTLNLPIIKSPALREDNLGIFEGWKWEVEKDPLREKLWAERHAARDNHDIYHRSHGTESLHHHLSRVRNFFYELERFHQEGTVIVVSHGGTINRIMEIFSFKDSINKEFYIGYKNTSVSIMEKSEQGYQLTLDNDISHLERYNGVDHGA